MNHIEKRLSALDRTLEYVRWQVEELQRVVSKGQENVGTVDLPVARRAGKGTRASSGNNKKPKAKS